MANQGDQLLAEDIIQPGSAQDSALHKQLEGVRPTAITQRAARKFTRPAEFRDYAERFRYEAHAALPGLGQALSA